MGKKLVSLALALTLALTLVPAALAAGQFTDVADTSPYAASIAWAVEKQITNGTTPTTFGPGNTCTTSHILTFLWRANGRPGDEGDEKAAVTAWANSLDIDASDLNAPCTRANAVTYMWKAAGSPAPETAASFTDVAADAPYASAVSWAVEQGVTKGASDTAFAPYDTCTRGQIVTFLCRQLDPEAAKAQPAAAQPEAAPAAQPDSPEAVLAAIQGVWREEKADGSIQEYLIEGNTLTSMWSSADGKKMHYATAPIQLVASGVENCYDVKIADGVDHPRTEYNDGVISVSKYGIPANVNFMAFFKVDGKGWVKNGGVERSSSSVLAEKINHIKELENQQQAAVSKYATYAKWPTVPDFGAIFGLPDRTNNEPLEYIPGLDPTIIDRINAAEAKIKSKSDITTYTYDRADAGSYEKLLDLENQYVSILKECGFTASMKNTAAGGRGLYYSKGNVNVSLGWNEPHYDWAYGSQVHPDHMYVTVQTQK